MVFTRTDKVLIDRAARFMRGEAAVLLRSHGPVWSATKDGRKAKDVHDRLLRDERDLRALAKRLEGLAKTLPAAIGLADPIRDLGKAPDTNG